MPMTRAESILVQRRETLRMVARRYLRPIAGNVADDVELDSAMNDLQRAAVDAHIESQEASQK